MGTLRLTLAFCVIIAHTCTISGFTGIGGSAVMAFFVISGFYMQLILSSRYARKNGVFDFYINRFLRLYPMYWAALILALLVYFFPHDGQTFIGRIGYQAYMFFVNSSSSIGPVVVEIPNILLIGSDVARLFCISPTTGHVVLQHISTYSNNCRGLDMFLLYPQIWTLSVEIMFYLFAPLLARMKDLPFIAFVIASIFITNMASTTDVYWRQLPFWYNVSFFVIGMLACRCYRASEWFFERSRYILSLVPFVVCIYYPHLIENATFADNWAIWIIYAMSLPALFTLSRNNKIDSRLGDLSYPVYLTHWIFAWPSVIFGSYAAFVTMILSALTSLLLIWIVEMPLRQTRRRVRAGAAAAHAGAIT